MVLDYIESGGQCADIFTKAFTEVHRWHPVCRLIAHFLPSDLSFVPDPPKGSHPRGGHPVTKAASKAAPAVSGGSKKENEMRSQGSGGRKTATRRCIEWCCGTDSLIGQDTPESAGCDKVRVTIAEDASSPADWFSLKKQTVEPTRYATLIRGYQPWPCQQAPVRAGHLGSISM